MKRRVSLFILSIQTVLFLLSCSGGRGKTVALLSDGDTLHMRYAEHLTVVSYPDYKVVTLRNPWDTLHVLQTYVLVPRDESLPEPLPQGTVVRVPLAKTVVYSSVHCHLLRELGVLDAIGGVCELEYIPIPEIQEGCRSGRMADIGNSQNPDMEKLIALSPDAILLSPFENSGGYGRLDKLGVPIVECADYMETSALGRAEWMRFYGLLYGVPELADSIFAAVEHRYRTLAAGVEERADRPKLFTDLKSGSAWYVPGGGSTLGRLFADAGIDYAFGYLPDYGSVPLNFETVFDKAKDADFWLVSYNARTDKTYGELKNDYAPYAGFRAFRERNVYGCNTGKVLYFEETSFHPELFMEDLIKICFMDGKDTRYFTKLAE